VLLIHTGQHFSPEMSKVFFDDLELPLPDIHLGAGGGTPTQQTVGIMRELEGIFATTRPSLVLVVGDVNSTLSAALTAAQMHIPVAHVEAGLRSFDRGMPEELNRIVTDAISDYLFVSEQSGVTNLLAEGVDPNRIYSVGNVMIDTLLRFRAKAGLSPILSDFGLAPGSYGVATIHRPSNVDDPLRLAEMVKALTEISKLAPVVFPVHPRTRKRINEFGICLEHLILSEPLGYLDFLHLMSNARLMVTDSGGIQEETTVLGIPCLTARENTERPITITHGTNRLVGVNSAEIADAARQVLTGMKPEMAAPDLWDGHASKRIADILEQQLDADVSSRCVAAVLQ
jgi:UDP-N-acetylglucosamine 2-epimerase (non-hydrolysing)